MQRNAIAADSAGGPVRISEAEAAQLIGVKARTLNHWRQVRRGPPYYRTEGKILYDAQEVEDWFQAQRVLPPLGPDA